MADSAYGKQDEKGLSARYLILVFLLCVAACAVFFSLGFLVGYNERTSKSAAETEQVAPSGVVPPTVNPLPARAPSTAKVSPPSSSRDLPPEPIAAPESGQGEPRDLAALIPPGTLPAKAAAKPTPSPTSRRDTRAVETGYSVQVAASRDQRDAEKLVKELRSRGFDVHVVRPPASDAHDTLYRVQAGPFPTRGEAVRIRDRIGKEGFKPFVKH